MAFRALLRGQLSRYSFSWSSGNVRKYNIPATRFSVIYREYGDPSKVLTGKSEAMPWALLLDNKYQEALGPDDLAIRMLAAPINPADINTIQGVYPVKPAFPAVAGNEGVGEVMAVGENSEDFSVGDWVVPPNSWGTWKTDGRCKAAEVTKIPNDISVVSAATMAVNPCTAYRMLMDFQQLQPGDVVLQNGANSGVGQSVIQIAADMGLQTVNIIRSRPNVEALVHTLTDLGATHVVTDEFVRTPQMKELMQSFPVKPRLALNCVGGKASAELLKYLGKRATMVTYGGMSKQPLMVPAGPLIFNDIELKGFWMTRWKNEHWHSQEKQDMWSYLCNLVHKNKLKPPNHRKVYIEDFKEAVVKSMEPSTNEKQILVMNRDLLWRTIKMIWHPVRHCQTLRV